MSIFDSIQYHSESLQSTKQIAKSMASSLYAEPCTILLSGEMGAGKTVFAQGFAQGLGIALPVHSPTFALEQRFDDKLLHIDLYRLQPKEAQALLHYSDDFPGIKLIEWPERAETTFPLPLIHIVFDDLGPSIRQLKCELRDVTVPTQDSIDEWFAEVLLPEHIRNHAQKVTEVADACASTLIKNGTFVRPHALHCAALLHDLLRFVDFKALDGDEMFKPSAKQSETWQKLKDRYGQPHELAAERFLAERGYDAIGTIVAAHGAPRSGRPTPITTEQRILAYSDKRVSFEQIVSVDERFDDIIARYGKGKDPKFYRKWMQEVKNIERDLFPDGPPL